MTLPDVVIPVRPGLNEELRFTLRSLVNVPHGQVHIYGYAPPWVDDTRVRVVRLPKLATKGLTVGRNIRAACEDPEVPARFLLFNDDFYITRPIPRVPVLNWGRVRDVVTRLNGKGIRNRATRAMTATADRLEELGYESPWSFELHVPMMIRGRTMLRALDLGADVPGFNRRTAYGAVAGLRGRTITDVKIYRATDPVPDGPFLSTHDGTFRYMRPMLRQLFPKRGPYERGLR